jgi:hypothetical protein
MSDIQTNSSQSLIINKKMVIGLIPYIWGLIIIFLAWADIRINHFEWIKSGAIQRLVNITRDDGLPNWFSSIQLLFIAIVLWIIVLIIIYSKPKLEQKKTDKWAWAIIAMFFTFLAVDDGSKFHERVGTAFRNSIEARHEYDPGVISKLFDVFPSYGWQFVFVPILGLMAIFIILFLYKNLNSKIQLVYILAGFACFVCSVVLDFVEGLDEEVYNPIVAFFDTDLHTIQHFSKLIEEIAEMVGNTFFMLAFSKQLLSIADSWQIRFSN